MVKYSTDLPSQKRIFCNKCKTETNHVLQGDHARENVEYYEEDGETISVSYWEKYIYRFWICAGCDSGALEECWTTDGLVDRNGKRIYQSEYFPKRSEYDVDGKHFKQLPQKLDNIYRETIQAFNNKLYLLCAAGLRSLIEGICEDKQVKGKKLEDKINALVGILPQNIVINLHSFRFTGNHALHEMIAPKPGELRLAIEISEDLLNFLYELDYKARLLPAKVKRNEIKEDSA